MYRNTFFSIKIYSIYNIYLLAYNINLLIHYAKGTLLFIQLELLIKLLLGTFYLTELYSIAHV